MVPPVRLKPHERRFIQQKLIEWIERFNGAHREKFMKLCEEMGLVRHELNRLRSPLQGVRIEAVYHLGAMRSIEAVPSLMKMLQAHKYDPAVFIIARSIAKCATQIEHLREMVLLLVRYRKNVCQLAADILQETELDYTPLLTEFLSDEDGDIVRIALTG